MMIGKGYCCVVTAMAKQVVPGSSTTMPFWSRGLLDLHEGGGPSRTGWTRALDLTRTQIAQFWHDSGDFFYDSVADETLR